jgi:hypothetical protein
MTKKQARPQEASARFAKHRSSQNAYMENGPRAVNKLRVKVKMKKNARSKVSS